PTGRRSATPAGRPCRRTGGRRPSSSWPNYRATRWASCSSANCATPTGRAGRETYEAIMSDTRILTERRGHVLVITINRPEARNAFDTESSLALEAAVDQLDGDDSLFVGVITGAGGHFSAGADLKAAARGGQGGPAKRGGL